MRLVPALLATVLAGALVASDAPPADAQPKPIPQNGGVVIDAPPFHFVSDVGLTDAERRSYAQRILKPMLDMTAFFRGVYKLRERTFDDFAEHYSGNHFEKLIRVTVWQDRTSFLDNFQTRYRTKSIPGAYFGTSAEVDAYGKPTGPWLREIAMSAQDYSEEQVLRDAYHEMGHLFMRTYLVVGVEVPSWIEEGTAELFQFRVGNGTHPEAERLQRLGWLREVLEEKASIPWAEFTKVRNMDNLDFTWKDPLRSELQYLQAWSVIEFMLATPERADAFLRMLADFRRQAQQDEAALSRGPRERMTTYLYDLQEEAFHKAYGADLLKVEKIWQDWLEKDYDKELKKKPAVRYHRGEWALMQARFSKGPERDAHLARAEEVFHECMEKAPDQPEGWVGMGRLALERQQRDQALEQFATALTKGPGNAEAQLYGGIARVMRGDAANAVAPLAKVAADRPKSYEPNFWYGMALTAARGDVARAVRSFAIAGAAEPGSAGECSWWEGVADLLAGKGKDARQAFTRAFGGPGAPDNIGTWLAMAQAVEGAKSDALETLDKAAKDAKDADALVLRARLEAGKPLPAVAFDEHSKPHLDAAADFVPLPPVKPGKR